MVVDRFSSFNELQRIQLRWVELYQSDSTANPFLSWDWVNACLSAGSESWLILGVRDGGPYLAFLPLRFGQFPARGPALVRDLWLGLSPHADFAGMLGVADEESRFIPELARTIRGLRWDRFRLHNCSDSRLDALLGEFRSGRYRTAIGESTPCPYVDLPQTWDEYLSGRGKSTRRTIRAHLNKLESLPGYRLEFAPPDKAAAAIETLLRFHSIRWKKNLKAWRSMFGELFAQCYRAGCFATCAMYQGEAVIAIQGFFINQSRRTVVAYMIAHNPEYASYSPGVMLGCASIRRAIEEGFARYDLSRGAQEYKMSLATGVAWITNRTVCRRNPRVAVLRAGKAVVFCAKRVAHIFLAPRKKARTPDPTS